MSEILLSTAVRSNVASLRNTAHLMAQVQSRLSTGRKVGSALDNPASFFQASQMLRQAGELESAVERIATAQKTLEAAQSSLAALSNLVASAQSVANSALASTGTTASRIGTVAGLTGASSFGVGNGNTITVGDGAVTATITSTGTVSVQQIIDAVNNTSGLKAKASLTSDGRIRFEATQANQIVIGGTASVGHKAQFGLANGTTAAGTLNTARSSLAMQFDSILAQIDQLAGDAEINGVNLLAGDTLKIDFNQSGSSSLSISGTTVNAASLGLGVAQSTWQTDKDINDSLAGLKVALAQLQTQSSVIASNVTLVEARQEFTSSMIGTLKQASDNLVVADTNEEGAALLALQARQELSTTALSLAAQAESSVLRLFR